MRKLAWDDELAVIAQKWADQCESRGNKHDRSEDRVKCDGTTVGQNVKAGAEYPMLDDPFKNISKLMADGWFDREVRMFTERDMRVDSFV